MFPRRCFPGVYFAPRYFPPVVPRTRPAIVLAVPLSFVTEVVLAMRPAAVPELVLRSAAELVVPLREPEPLPLRLEASEVVPLRLRYSESLEIVLGE